MLNNLSIQGNLVADVETRYTGGGLAVASIRLANNRKRDGKEEVLFLDVTMFGKTAEAFAKYNRKGSQVLLEGRLTMDEWEDRDTKKKRQKIKMIANSWHFVGSKPQQADAGF